MAAKKTLAQLVLDGTFLARKDRQLLAGAELPWPAFAALQLKYRAASEDFERRAVALAFERLVRQARAQASERLVRSPAEALAELGPPGSFQQLERFFPGRFATTRALMPAGPSGCSPSSANSSVSSGGAERTGVVSTRSACWLCPKAAERHP